MRPRVKILDQEYELPALAGETLAARQDQVQVRQRAIREGVRPRPAFLGFIPRNPAPLTPRDRFEELQLLVQDYGELIRELIDGKDRYDAFLGSLAQGVRGAIHRKMAEIRTAEHERVYLLTRAQGTSDRVLEQQVKRLGDWLHQTVRVMVHATLLILRKIEVCRRSLVQLAEDQTTQRRVLEEMMGRLEAHAEARQLGEKIAVIARDVAAMANVALNFDQVLEHSLGPLSTLVDHVTAVDGSLHAAVMEIEGLARTLEGEQLNLLRGAGGEDRLVDFVVAGAFKRERLVEALQQARAWDEVVRAFEMGEVAGPEDDTLRALDNLQVLLDTRLA